MITTVTLNPAIDRTIVVERFAFGSVNRVVRAREDMGGKGINVARVLVALGSRVLATGFIGHDNLDHVRQLIDRDGIPVDFVTVAGATRQNTKLIEASSQTTTDINEAGFAISEEHLSDLKSRIRSFAAQSSFVVFSGSVPRGLPQDVYRDLIDQVAPVRRTILDADGAHLLAGLAGHPYLIKPNLLELENALGRPLPTQRDIVRAARELSNRYKTAYILVSMGASGSILITADRALHASSVPVIVRGTVGAGDAMLAGFIHGIDTGMTDRESLAWATACGALAVSNEGTETIDKQSVIRLAGQVSVTALAD